MAEAENGATEAPAASESNESAAKNALIAELEAEIDDSGEEAVRTEKPKPGKKRLEAAKEDAANEGEEPEAEEDAGEEEPESAAAQLPDAVREHVRNLVDTGDIRQLEVVLGLEKGALKVDGGKIRYARQRLEKAEKAQSKASEQHAAAQNVLTQAQQAYGPMVRAKQLFQGGTAQGVQQAARFVESHFGVPLTQFVETVLKAGRGESAPQRGPDPEVVELKQTVQQLLQERQRQQQQETERTQTERHVATIKGKLGSSPIAKLPDAAQLVYAKIKGSYDATIDGYTLTLKDAIAAVASDPATKWRLHELAQKSARTAPVVTPTALKTTPGRKPPPRGKLSPAEQEAAEKSALIAELESSERKRERAERYGKH
jgi:hypothetical protein